MPKNANAYKQTRVSVLPGAVESQKIAAQPAVKFRENASISHVPAEQKLEHKDGFEVIDPKKIKARKVMSQAKALMGKPIDELKARRAPVLISEQEAIGVELGFVKAPSVEEFLYLEKDFRYTMSMVGFPRYSFVRSIAIDTNGIKNETKEEELTKSESKLEDWHNKHVEKLINSQLKGLHKTQLREQKIEEKGEGNYGKWEERVLKCKQKSYYMKNNYTIRGNVFKLTHLTCPRNIYEIMPRYGARKGAYIGIRTTTFILNGALGITGYAAMPVSFGVSKVVCENVSTLVTLTGEISTFKLIGADTEKCVTHASMRGLQLTIPHLVPIAGDVVEIGENGALATAALGIVASYIADAILEIKSDRYRPTLNSEEIGDSLCLSELNHRIEYLSEFLLPYGQYLMLKEEDPATKKELKHILKGHFKTLRQLEKKKLCSLNYYMAALAADRIPDDRREQIFEDCKNAEGEAHLNTHRKVRQCLAALLAKDKASTI